uniref:Uncharacterized protein n=1 Tax=Myoviridae sp. ctTK08 TaxID=2826656 RepID=A0A8S5QWG6_9CAUD|nr:MAG TPA: hypothetical protein [Myoviridae sp. ctTK08]DAX37339.1 MAG TPA: hypothetical protein [Caudoviricetes sp.]
MWRVFQNLFWGCEYPQGLGVSLERRTPPPNLGIS